MYTFLPISGLRVLALMLRHPRLRWHRVLVALTLDLLGGKVLLVRDVIIHSVIGWHRLAGDVGTGLLDLCLGLFG